MERLHHGYSDALRLAAAEERGPLIGGADAVFIPTLRSYAGLMENIIISTSPVSSRRCATARQYGRKSRYAGQSPAP